METQWIDVVLDDAYVKANYHRRFKVTVPVPVQVDVRGENAAWELNAETFDAIDAFVSAAVQEQIARRRGDQ